MIGRPLFHQNQKNKHNSSRDNIGDVAQLWDIPFLFNHTMDILLLIKGEFQMSHKYVDLHIHSYYSDGTMSPQEILDEAIKKNIGLLAITDHDILEGSMELLQLALNSNTIKCISGVELDALDNGINFHILGYHVDLTNKDFTDFVHENRNCLEEINIRLIEKMQKDYSNINMSDYLSFTYDHRKGGWKTLHYFMEKGLTNSLIEGFELYMKYNNPNSTGNFPSIETVCQYIHKAGGKAILAHPGRVIKEDSLTKFKQMLQTIMSFGLDGIECYYPSHSEDITLACIDYCKRNNLIITSGSDCHGKFEKTEIGEMKIPIEELYLSELY